MALESKPNKKKKIIIITAVVVLLLGAGVFAYLKLFPKKIQKGTLTESPTRPEEVDPIKAGYLWQGGPEDPKKIVIPNINVDGYIQNVGKDKNNQVVAPGNIFIAGWYTQSSRPGKKGLSIIDGHLNGYTKDGIFINLEKLKVGDELSVEMGDGTKYQYKVISNDTVDEDKATAYLFSQSPKVKKQLNLITCGGDYDKKNHLYSKRVIVGTEQIN